MLSLTKQKAAGGIVGLDIAAGSLAAAEVVVNGAAQVARSAIAPLEAGVVHEGEVVDPDRLVGALKSFFAAEKLPKRVRLGVGNQRVVVRTVRLPAIEDPAEMEAAVRFQAEEQIPMPLDQAVLEHQVVGGVAAEEGGAAQVDVVLAAARREMIESFLEPLRRADLEPVGIDLSAFAMIRALAERDAEATGAVLYCDLGDVANLAVARGRACLFTRVSYAGLEAMSARLESEAGITAEHASQWLSHVGLELPLEQVEGDAEIVAVVRDSLEQGVSALIDELRLSLDYYSAQDGAVAVERVVLCGSGSSIAGLPARMEEALGSPISVARPAAFAEFEAPVAARLTLPYGLALED